MKNIGYRDYENVSNIDNIGMGRLARVYSTAVDKRKSYDIKKEQEFNLSIPHLRALKNKLAQQIDEEVDRVSGHLPVISVFDALQVVKARKDAKRNIGLRALGSYLDQIWKKSRTADLSADTFLNLKEHYSRNYPKAGMDSVFSEMQDKGYFTLPMSDLMHIASQIQTQEDFNDVMVEYGLSGKQPHQVKARRFILAALNGESV